MAQLSTQSGYLSSNSRRFRAVPAALAVALLGVQGLGALPALGTTGSSYGFNSPVAAVVSGSDLFVANSGGNSVTEVNAATGALVTVVTGAQYHFDDPVALATVAGNVFVASSKNSTITEFAASTGVLVRTVSGAKDFDDPVALAGDGPGYLFVLSQGGGGSVAEVAVGTGKVTSVASGSPYDFDQPTAITFSKGDLFVTNSLGNSVTDIAATTMTLVSVLSASSYGFDEPIGIASHGGNVWVSNLNGKSLTEFAATTGTEEQVVTSPDDNYLPTPEPIAYGAGHVFVASPPGGSPMITQVVPTDPSQLPWMMCNTNGPYTFSNPQALVTYGTNLWVVNEGGAGGPTGNSLTEMNADTGALIQVVS
jgi:hypothetical protein